MVFPVPGSPVTATEKPLGIPPASISSRADTPVESLSTVKPKP
jgi:hypothetical protein